MLTRDDSVLVVIDVQEGYRGHTVEHDRMVRAVRTLIEAAKLMMVPILATEQYPKGLGHTQPEVADGFPAGTPVIEKLSMSCCGQPDFVDRLRALGRAAGRGVRHRGARLRQPDGARSARSRLPGARALRRHLGALRARLRVGWQKIVGSGAVPSTVEMVCLEWVRTAEAPEFKAIHKLIK